jgi:hypothetical protein
VPGRAAVQPRRLTIQAAGDDVAARESRVPMKGAEPAGTRVAEAADDEQAHESIRLLLDEGGSLDAPL